MAKNMNRKNMLVEELKTQDISSVIENKSNKSKTTVASRQNKDRVQFGSKGAPSKAQLALIERYKCDKHTDVVNNTLDGIISEEIEKIKVAVDNMIQYGDVNVFKVLPKELDSYIRDYGLAAQEYFGRSIKDMDGMMVTISPVHFRQCNKCRKFKHPQNFFKSKSDLSPDGYAYICKDCANELFNKYLNQYHDIKECLVLICQKLDFCIYEPVLEKYITFFDDEKGKEAVLDNSFLGRFISDLWIELYHLNLNDDELTFSKTNLGGIPFKELTKPYGLNRIYDDRLVEKENETASSVQEPGKRGINKLKEKWGDFSSDDLFWLERKYEDWKNDYDIRGMNRETLVRQLCHSELEIYKKRQVGEDVLKDVKSFQELLKSSELTPKATSKNAKNAMFSSMGAMISALEKTKPIIEVDPEFEDVDNLTKIWESMAGALARTTNIKSPLIQKFEENMKDNTVSFETEGQ